MAALGKTISHLHLPGSTFFCYTEMLFFLKAFSLKDTAKKQLN